MVFHDTFNNISVISWRCLNWVVGRRYIVLFSARVTSSTGEPKTTKTHLMSTLDWWFMWLIEIYWRTSCSYRVNSPLCVLPYVWMWCARHCDVYYDLGVRLLSQFDRPSYIYWSYIYCNMNAFFSFDHLWFIYQNVSNS